MTRDLQWRADHDGKGTGATRLWLIGHEGTPETHELREFLTRNRVDHVWVDVDRDPLVHLLVRGERPPTLRYPVCLFPDGEMLEAPTTAAVAERVGLWVRPSLPEYDLAILGAGPAGLTAAVYGASEGLRTVVIERDAPGGQAGTSSRIENYLGFPEGISGMELAKRAIEQASRFGAEFVVANEPAGADPDARSPFIVYLQDGSRLAAHAAIIATGMTYRLLDAPGVRELLGRGVYYGTAMSEVQFYRNKRVYILGGGNSAGQAAAYLAQFALEVTLLVKNAGLELDMSDYLIRQISAEPHSRVRLRTRMVACRGEATLA